MNLARSKSRLQLEQLPDQRTALEAKNLESMMSITSSDKQTDGSNSTGRERGSWELLVIRLCAFLIRRVSDSQQASLLVVLALVLVAAPPDGAHAPFRPPKTLTLALAQPPLIFLSKSLECAEGTSSTHERTLQSMPVITASVGWFLSFDPVIAARF